MTLNEEEWMFYEEPKAVTVFEEDGYKSRVLDKNGDPYALRTKFKLGFDLTPRRTK